MYEMSEIDHLLYTAVLNGDVEEVRLLMSKGADVNKRIGSKLETFLHVATHVPIIQELLQQGADVDALNLLGESPLLRAIVDGKGLQVVSMLLSANADVKRKYCGATLLHYTLDIEVIRLLLSHGLDVNSKNIQGRTPLHCAADSLGDFPRVRVLLEYGAHVNAVDNNSETPLHGAVNNVNSMIKDGNVDGVVHYNSYQNAMEVVQLLLDYGANISISKYGPEDEPYSSPLGYAEYCGHSPLIKLLIKFQLINHINTHDIYDPYYHELVDWFVYGEEENHEEMYDYMEDCIKELVKIKTENVSDNYLLSDFVGFEKKRNIKALYNHNIDEKHFRENYPIYCDIILSRLQFSIERGYMLEKLRHFHMHTGFESSGNKIVVVPDCLYKIGEYMPSDDLKHFMEALDPQY